MSFASYLEGLRAKPEHIRKRYAFWSSFGVTALIFAFWLGSFSSVEIGAKQSVAKVVDKAGTPTQSLVAGVGAFGQDIWELVFGSKKVTYSEIEILPGN